MPKCFPGWSSCIFQNCTNRFVYQQGNPGQDVVRSAADEIDQLPQKIKDGITQLRGLDIGDQVTIEILANLVDGRKTVAEIVERIYGLNSQDEGYFSAYSRIRRGVRRLESKGLVSTGILGREKPYRLTDLAMINLARIGGGAKQSPVIPVKDAVTYISTLALSVPLILVVARWAEFSEPVLVGLFGVFCFLFGISFSRLVQSIRRVF